MDTFTGQFNADDGIDFSSITDVTNTAKDAGINLGDVGKGAATGAALGTIVPGIGNIVGGAVGAIAGLGSGVINMLKGNPSAWAKASDVTKEAIIDSLIYRGIWKEKKIVCDNVPGSLLNYILEQLKATGQGDYQYVDFYAKNNWVVLRAYAALGASADGGTVVNKDLADRVSQWYKNNVFNPPPPPADAIKDDVMNAISKASTPLNTVKKADTTVTKVRFIDKIDNFFAKLFI